MLTVQALGTLRVFLDDTPVAFAVRKAEELLCLLLIHRGHPVDRAILAEVLWPMRPPGKAVRNLSTTLWRLRQALGESPCIHSERNTLRLTSTADCRFDADEFESAAQLGLTGPLPCDPHRLGELECALELYGGDFLAGRYGDWCLSERERLKLLFVRVLKRLLFHFRISEAYDDAIEKGHRLLAIDPLQEDVHRELMRCYAQSGRRSQALEQFETCRRILQQELRIGPMPETCQLQARIRSNQISATLLEPPTGVPLSLRQALIRFGQALDTLEGAWRSLQASGIDFPDAESES